MKKEFLNWREVGELRMPRHDPYFRPPGRAEIPYMIRCTKCGKYFELEDSKYCMKCEESGEKNAT